MKLLLVTPYFPPHIGGAENYAYNIAKGLKEKYGWEIVIITSNHEENTYKEKILEGMKIYRLARQFKISNTPISFKWKKQISDIIDKENPDIINAHSPVPFISDVACRIANKNRIPFVLTYHAATLYKKDKLIENSLIFLYELFLGKKTKRLSNKIITESNFVKLQFSKEVQKKTEIIYNAISEREMTNTNEMTKKEYDLVFLSNLDKTHEWKGLKIIIESIRIYNEKYKNKIKLIVIGEGNYRYYYEGLTKEYDLSNNIIFTGKKFGPEKDKLIKKSKILLTYPTAPNDAFPTVFLEAWISGTPILASNIGPIPSLINNKKDGFLVESNNPKILAEKINYLIRNPKLREKLARNGYKKVKENFTWGKQIAKTNKLFLNILK